MAKSSRWQLCVFTLLVVLGTMPAETEAGRRRARCAGASRPPCAAPACSSTPACNPAPAPIATAPAPAAESANPPILSMWEVYARCLCETFDEDPQIAMTPWVYGMGESPDEAKQDGRTQSDAACYGMCHDYEYKDLKPISPVRPRRLSLASGVTYECSACVVFCDAVVKPVRGRGATPCEAYQELRNTLRRLQELHVHQGIRRHWSLGCRCVPPPAAPLPDQDWAVTAACLCDVAGVVKMGPAMTAQDSDLQMAITMACNEARLGCEALMGGEEEPVPGVCTDLEIQSIVSVGAMMSMSRAGTICYHCRKVTFASGVSYRIRGHGATAADAANDADQIQAKLAGVFGACTASTVVNCYAPW